MDVPIIHFCLILTFFSQIAEINRPLTGGKWCGSGSGYVSLSKKSFNYNRILRDICSPVNCTHFDKIIMNASVRKYLESLPYLCNFTINL